MKPKFNSPRIPPGLPAWLAKEWDSLEWSAQLPARKPPVVLPEVPKKLDIASKRNRSKGSMEWRAKKRDKLHRKLLKRIGDQIAAEFEAERKRMLAEALKKQKEYDLELVLMAAEEKQAAAVKAYLEQCQREAAAYIAKLKRAAA